MSEMSVKARDAMKAKARERAGRKDDAKVDASDYHPEGGVFGSGQTYPYPPKPRKYKRGGKIVEMHGEAKAHGGKKPRKAAGGETGAEVPETRFQMGNTGGSWMDRAAGLKTGGKADGHWIENAHIKKGALHKELGVPEGSKIPQKRLKAAEHSGNKLERERADFAENMRKERKSGGQLAERENVAQRPNALRRRMGGKAEDEKHGPHCGCPRCSGGSVTDGAEEGTRPEKGGRLARAGGGRTKKSKGAMNVNIVIATGKNGQPQMGPGAPPPGPPPPPPGGLPPPRPGAPMAGPPPGAPPPMPPPQMPPPRPPGS
jgi:hypothetical protein